MSIQISKTSWHFKMVKFFFDGNSRGLCQYVRRLILSMCIATCLFFVGCGAIWFMFGLPIKFALSYFIDITYAKDELVMTAISGLVWAFCTVCICGSFIKDRFIARRKPKPEKKPSVFIEYIKAKKQKVCPNIEFV